MNNSEIILLYQIINDDVKAFEQIFEQYYSELCRFTYVYIKEKEIAEEIVQEVFIHFWKIRKQLHIQRSIKSYLYTSTKNRALNYIRDNKHMHHVKLNNAYRNEEPEETHYLEYSELARLIEDAINHLPEKCKEIFLLSRDANLSNQEIAEKLNLSVKTVKNQLGIALQKLRAHLEPYLDKMLTLLVLFCNTFLR